MGDAARRDHPAYALVVRRVDDDDDVGEVLGGSASHRRAADVDILQRVVQRRSVHSHGVRKGIEIVDDNIDGRNPVLGDLLHVAALGPPRQQSAMYCRMQGLDAAVENFGRTGHLRHLQHFELRCA